MNAQSPEDLSAKVADEVLDLIMAEIQRTRGAEVERAVTAAAALAGCYLLRDTGIDLSKLAPGSPILAEQVDSDGPRLISLMQHFAGQFGLNAEAGWEHEISPDKVSPALLNHQVSQFEARVSAVFAKYGFPTDARAGLMAATAIRIVAMGKKLLAEDIGKSLALSALVNSSKTVPPRNS